MTKHSLDTPQFYLTAPQTCPYLPGRYERKVFTHLVGKNARQINDMLTHGGFRRSQNIAYRPTCERCRACISTRVIVDAYKPSRNLRRITSRNRDLVVTELPASPTAEQYSIFRAYLDARHHDGGMVDMTALDYSMMVEDTHVDTMLVEYRLKHIDDAISDNKQGELVAVALTDVLSNGLSMVYSFFDPEQTTRSLGTFMIADHIQRARSRGLPYVYLGYWVKGSSKMNYKTRFKPQEHLTINGWRVAD